MELFKQACTIMGLGMGFVFVFLAVVILCVQVTARVVRRYETAVVAGDDGGADSGLQEKIAAAIAAAIHEHQSGPTIKR